MHGNEGGVILTLGPWVVCWAAHFCTTVGHDKKPEGFTEMEGLVQRHLYSEKTKGFREACTTGSS